jgi:hypothetical protein
MKKITRSVIKLSELPQHLKEDDMLYCLKTSTIKKLN